MPIPEDHGGSANPNSHNFQIKRFTMEVQAKYTYSSNHLQATNQKMKYGKLKCYKKYSS